ncbi:hypothetical protein cyc_05608 [Cyclospora cayetanensis]|uniref:Uncharacterized protein n=1 Tax=Cyclospora cayetanensis TaxID=88456 RepID=A0A1D3CR76_9EIME|nr:hypothetical protein cyc_05608 [Cyclospora cayetanensis]
MLSSDLRDRISEVEKPDAEGLVRAAVEKHLSEYLRRCNELNQKWQVQITNFGEELKRLKAEEIVELRTSLASQAAQLSSLDSDMQVLRQLLPVHGASLKATEAALQLLREGTERSIEGMRHEIMLDQKRRMNQEERAKEQQGEAEEALEALRADLSALKKSCRQSNVALLQLREALPEAVAFSQDVTTLRRDAEQQAAKVAALGRSLSTVEEQQNLKGRELDRLRSEVGMIKTAVHHFSSRGPDLTRAPEFQQLRADLTVLSKRLDVRQSQARTKEVQEFAEIRGEVQRLRTEVDYIKGTKLRALQSSEKAAAGMADLSRSIEALQHQIDALSSKQVRTFFKEFDPLVSTKWNLFLVTGTLSRKRGVTCFVPLQCLSFFLDSLRPHFYQLLLHSTRFPQVISVVMSLLALSAKSRLKGSLEQIKGGAFMSRWPGEGPTQLSKRRVNFGHHVAQQHQIQHLGPLESGERKVIGLSGGPTASLDHSRDIRESLSSASTFTTPRRPPSVLRSARSSPSPVTHTARVSFKEPPESTPRLTSNGTPPGNEHTEEERAETAKGETRTHSATICSELETGAGERALFSLQFSEPHPEVEDLHDFALDKATDTQQGPAATVETPDACATVEMQQQSAEARVSPPADDPVKPLV